MQGALLIDKPAGPTSHDVVAFVRRALNVDRAGHTGTLDPLATGLLIVLVGRATRLAQFLAADEKEYIADVRLGVATPTYDAAGLEARDAGREVREARDARREVRGAGREEIADVLNRFRGTFLQMPPPFSAKKIASVPAYEKARKNQAVELKPVEVTVRTLEIVDDIVSASSGPSASRLAPHDPHLVRLRVSASAGFYVRSLAHDVGQALGCGAHLEALRRTRVGRFRVEDALTLDRVEAEGAMHLTSPANLLGQMPAVTVTDDGAVRVAHGNPIRPFETEKGTGSVFGGGKGEGSLFRVLDTAGTLLAVAEPRPGGVLQPVVVLR